MRKLIATLVAILGFAIVGVPAWADEPRLDQSVTVDGATADVSVARAPQSGYRVGAFFHVAKGSPIHLACLSLNQDFRFDLRDSTGQIKLNELALLSDASVAVSGAFFGRPPSSPVPCERDIANFGGKEFNVLLLAKLYPNLPPGTYTLQLIFAPHEVSEKIVLPPLRLIVDKEHPL